MLFECPTALYVWTLSDVPSLPGCFPSSSFYHNMDFLLWKMKDMGLLSPQEKNYSWIIWYIWKARNDKVFNGKKVPPPKSLQLASLEAESWRITSTKDCEDETEETQPWSIGRVPPLAPQILTCQIDASWIDHGPVSELGWCLWDNMGRHIFGVQGCRRSLSILHVEMDGFFWAMSSLKEKRILSVSFETECSNRMEWPAFRLELDFLFFF